MTQLSFLELPPDLSNVGAAGASLPGEHEELKGSRATLWPQRAVTAARLGKTKSRRSG